MTADMIAEIKALDPKPAANYDSVMVPVVVPDLLMRQGPVPSIGLLSTLLLPKAG